MKTSPFAGKPAEASLLIEVPKLIAAEAQTITSAALAAAPESGVKALPLPHNPTVGEAVDAWRNEGDPN